ncbi:MAG: DUF6198 family protein [Angelakisella sp.]|nr:DUF6198 family protein [Angelakisella sp.]
MSNNKFLLRRMVIYCLGILIMATSVVVSVRSNLGVSPVSAIPYVQSQIFQVEMGLCTTATFLVFILLQVILLGRKFQLKNLLQIFVATLYGSFVSFMGWVATPLPQPATYPARLFFAVLGIVLLALGIMLYTEARIMCLPPEGLMEAIAQRFGIQRANAKIMLDSTCVVVAVVLSVLILHNVQGVREGTVLAAVGIGSFLKLFQKLLGSRLKAFLHGEVLVQASELPAALEGAE